MQHNAESEPGFSHDIVTFSCHIIRQNTNITWKTTVPLWHFSLWFSYLTLPRLCQIWKPHRKAWSSVMEEGVCRVYITPPNECRLPSHIATLSITSNRHHPCHHHANPFTGSVHYSQQPWLIYVDLDQNIASAKLNLFFIFNSQICGYTHHLVSSEIRIPLGKLH